jgi:pimeloyl-ACP methyl ester carboxylesterase
MKPLSGFSPEDFADDLFLITQDLGWEKFILVGHSMGGRNAMSFAHRFPHMVEKLIIEDIGPDGDIGAVEHFKSLLDLVPVPFVSRDEAKNFFMGEFLQKAEEQGRDNPNMLGQFFYANLKVDPDTGLVDWIFSKHAIIQSLIEGRVKPRWFDWENLNMPTLLVRGERSKDLSEDVFNEMLRRNRMAKGVVVPESGHWIHAEKPKEFLKVILEFKNNA